MTTYIAICIALYIAIGFFLGLYAAYDTEDSSIATACFVLWPVVLFMGLMIGFGHFLVYIAKKIRNRGR
jgi:hypothetical protein